MGTRPISSESLWKLARVAAPVPVPDREAALVTVKTFDLATNKGTDVIWLVPYDGTPPRALTSPEHGGARGPVPSPDGRTVAFLRRPAGKNEEQLWLLPIDGGEARCVTDLPLGAADPRFLPDGRAVVVVSNVLREAPTLAGTREALARRVAGHANVHVTEDRVYRYWDRWLTGGEVPHFFVVDLEARAVRDVTPASTRWLDLMDPDGQYDVSPDGLELAFSANATEPPYAKLKWAIYTVPVAGGEPRCLAPQAPADDVRPRYTPDGRFLVWGMRVDPDFYADRVRLVRYDRASGATAVLTEGWDRSAASWAITPDGRTLVVEAEERGRSCLFRLPVAGGTPERFWADGSAHGPRCVDDRRVVFSSESLVRPPEATIAPIDGGESRRFGKFNDARLAELSFGRVAEETMQGADGAPLQVWLVYPPGFEGGKRWPLVHMIHGGPHTAFGDQWHWRWNAQLFAAPGYVAALVNFHGSSSYGEAFVRSIHGAWGDKPARDIHAVTDALVARGIADERRVAVTGGSYGGYLTAWLTATSDRWACAVAHAAVTSLPAMYAGDVTDGFEKEIGAVAWEDRAAAERYSPVAWAKTMRTPTLVVHGEKDYRVPAAQGLELYGILKARGVPARLVYFPGENHWVLSPANSIRWYAEVHEWLARYLPAA